MTPKQVSIVHKPFKKSAVVPISYAQRRSVFSQFVTQILQFSSNFFLWRWRDFEKVFHKMEEHTAFDKKNFSKTLQTRSTNFDEKNKCSHDFEIILVKWVKCQARKPRRYAISKKVNQLPLTTHIYIERKKIKFFPIYWK